MEPTFKVELTASDIQIILAGLQELPLKISAMVFNKLQETLHNQQK